MNATTDLPPKTEAPVTGEAAALASIVSASATWPAWQRDALRRLCKTETLSAADVNELVAICKGEACGPPIAAEHVRDPGAGAATVRLRALHGLKHVNAIAADQRLSFDKSGLTVVYGDNGAGKSGYARLLKKICRARTSGKDEAILANIYSIEPRVPEASLDYAANDQNSSATWRVGQPGDRLLSAVSVFDSRTANVHVGETNDVAYTPLPLKMLAALAQACQDVKARLNGEIAALRQQTPAAIARPSCARHTRVGRLVAALSSLTSLKTVEELATLTPEERVRLDQLKSDLAADPAKTATRLLAMRTRLEGYRDRLRSFDASVGDAKALSLRQLAREASLARAAAAAASTALFQDEPIPHIGADAWRRLWESARAFSRGHEHEDRTFPPVEGEVCVLCQQEIGHEAADRMSCFEAFVADDAKRQEADANAAYNEAIQTVRNNNLSRQEVREMVVWVRDDLGDPDLARALRAYALPLLRRYRAVLRHHADTPDPAYLPAPTAPTASLAVSIADLNKRAGGLQADAGSGAREALVAECDELADRTWLVGMKDDVVAEISRRRTIAGLETALAETVTSKVTAKSTEIARLLVTDALRAEFQREVARLGVGRLAVELKQERSAQGIPRFRVALTRKPDAHVGEVLSEGEHRCVALAAFMAELATADSKSAIVFDDPVSSLDHLHRAAIAKRLAEEGQHRQVIVFTHDLAFLFLLNEACRDQDPYTHMAIRSVSRGGDAAGICSDTAPLRAQPVVNVIATMARRLEKEKAAHASGDAVAWEQTVRSLQEQLRTTWERAVEEAVSPVLQRMANKVQTPGLAKLTAISLQDCETMREAFGRCSALLHSEAAELNRPLPTPAEVEAEINALRDWAQSIHQRQQAIKPV